jgi:hypothetical protein
VRLKYKEHFRHNKWSKTPKFQQICAQRGSSGEKKTYGSPEFMRATWRGRWNVHKICRYSWVIIVIDFGLDEQGPGTDWGVKCLCFCPEQLCHAPSFRWVKRQDNEADRWRPSVTEVKNECRCVSALFWVFTMWSSTVGATLNLFTSLTQCFGRNEDENVF